VLAACSPSRSERPLPPRDPPARVLGIGLDHLVLRSSAYVELHAWLAAAGRDTAAPPPGLEGASTAYRKALGNDDRDLLLARTTYALESCTDDACAARALAGTPFERPFAGSLSTFVARWWLERASSVRGAVELVRSAVSPESDAVLERIVMDLAITWPPEPVAVVIVSDAPPAGRDALVPAVVAARGTCFRRSQSEPLADARALDCVFVHALTQLQSRSEVGRALEKELGGAGESAARAWQLLVVHAVAATMTAWRKEHLSAMRRSAIAVEPEVCAWLAEHWPERRAGESESSFAGTYARAWETSARAPH
jgi:hypothetical protein